jgi:LPS-assembly protein
VPKGRQKTRILNGLAQQALRVLFGLRAVSLAAAGLLVLSTLLPDTVRAQDPSVATASGKAASSFAKKPGGPFGGSPKKIDQASPLYLQADELIYDSNNNRVIARGNVEVYYSGYILTADRVVYDQSANTLTAEGSAMLKEPNGNVVRGERLTTTSDFRDAFIQRLSIISADETRIAGESATRRDGNVTEFRQGKFTPCKNDPGMPPLWCISAATVIHDQQAATITYKDAQFELFGVPIFYMPYFEHADPSVKRRSGFLTPEFSHSSTLGYAFEPAYYFALAPNYDFTFHPQYFSKQGTLWQGDWRHRVHWGQVSGQYTVKLAGIDQNGDDLPGDITAARKSELDGWRGSVVTQGLFSLASWWKFGWDVTVESDDTFRRFYKLDSILQTDRVNSVFLQGLNDRNYFGMTFYQFGGLLLEDKPLSESYVHPVIDYNYIVGQPVLGGELSFTGNALSLSRSDGADVNRAIFEGKWRRQLIDPLGQVWTPYLAARGDLYQISNGTDPYTQLALGDETVSRAMATAAITYAYPFVARNALGSHTIEPIGQIIARPASVDQRRMPDEDARSLIWDDTLLFDYDKFSGWDRIETGTRANVGLQYTFQANSGAYARFVVGQSFHLAGDNAFNDPGYDATGVALYTPRSGLETSRSDYVLGAYLSPFTTFRVVTQARLDESDLSLRRQDTSLTTTLGPLSTTFQHAYVRYDDTLGSLGVQQDVLASGTLRLTDRWSLTGLVRYDIDSDLMLQDQIGIKYQDECFVLTATYIETRITDATRDIKPDQTIMLRFELKHLGEFGYKVNPSFGENQPPKL